MLAEGFRICAYCGEPFVQGMRTKQYCSDRCRREYQNHRRRLERVGEAKQRTIPIRFCPVCGKPKRDMTPEAHEGKACSECCNAIRKKRAELGLPEIWHKPNYALAMNLVDVMPDPWKEGRLPEEVTENALADGGMAMPEEIDFIEYYQSKFEEAMNTGGPKDEATQKADPSPAEPEKPKKHKRGKRCRLMHR